jgi:hypothetical protein
MPLVSGLLLRRCGFIVTTVAVRRRAPAAYRRGYRCVVEGTPNPSARRITPVSAKGVLIDVVPSRSRWDSFKFARFRRPQRAGPDASATTTVAPTSVAAADCGSMVPLVAELFAVDPVVAEVFLSRQFLSVSLDSEEHWQLDSTPPTTTTPSPQGDVADSLPHQLFSAIDKFFYDGPASDEAVEVWLRRGSQASDAHASCSRGSSRYTPEELQLIEDIEFLLEEKAR